MKSSYVNSIFYTNENEVELFEKLGLYQQCFDYNGLFEFWTDYNNFEYLNNKSIFLPFRIYICDKIVPIHFNINNEV